MERLVSLFMRSYTPSTTQYYKKKPSSQQEVINVLREKTLTPTSQTPTISRPEKWSRVSKSENIQAQKIVTIGVRRNVIPEQNSEGKSQVEEREKMEIFDRPKITATIAQDLKTRERNVAIAIYKEIKNTHKNLVEGDPELGKMDLTRAENAILGNAGLNVLIHHMKSKPYGEKVNCFVCEDLGELQKCLKKVKESNFTGKIAFLVRSAQYKDDPPNKYAHVTPVLIEKKEDETKVFILDSTGLGSGGSVGDSQEDLDLHKREDAKHIAYAQNVYNQIFDAGLKSDPNSSKVTVYVTETSRQRDTTNCPVFSFSDVKSFFKSDDFFDQVETFGRCESPKDFAGEDRLDSDLRFVKNLPPASMKLTQFPRQLQEYLDTNQDPTESEFSYNEDTVKASKELAEKSSRNEYYMKADDRYAKSLYVINHYIEEHRETLSEITHRYESSKFLQGE